MFEERASRVLLEHTQRSIYIRALGRRAKSDPEAISADLVLKIKDIIWFPYEHAIVDTSEIDQVK